MSEQPKKTAIYDFIKRNVVDIWQFWVVSGVVVVFLWGPIKLGANIASRTDLVSETAQRETLAKRVNDLEFVRQSLEQDAALLNVAVAKLNNRITEDEEKYWNAQILRGQWDRATLQKRLYGVSNIIP